MKTQQCYYTTNTIRQKLNKCKLIDTGKSCQANFPKRSVAPIRRKLLHAILSLPYHCVTKQNKLSEWRSDIIPTNKAKSCGTKGRRS